MFGGKNGPNVASVTQEFDFQWAGIFWLEISSNLPSVLMCPNLELTSKVLCSSQCGLNLLNPNYLFFLKASKCCFEIQPSAPLKGANDGELCLPSTIQALQRHVLLVKLFATFVLISLFFVQLLTP